MRHPALPRHALIALLGALVWTLSPIAQARALPAQASAEASPPVHRHASHATSKHAGQHAVAKPHGQQHQVAQAHVHKSGVKSPHASGHSHVAQAGTTKAAHRKAGTQTSQPVAARSSAKGSARTAAHSGGAHRATAQKAGAQHVAHAGKSHHRKASSSSAHGGTPRA